jgi:uncharacterized protein (TIGR04255 family)
MVLDPNRPIYPRAPLKLVAFQLLFTPVPALDDAHQQQLLYGRLRSRFPILGAPPFVQLDMHPGGAQQTVRGMRVVDRPRTQTIVVASDSLSVETSRYTRYEDFAELLGWVLGEVDAIGHLASTTRIGLRYIDEVEIDGAVHPQDWRPWINNELLVGGIIDGYVTRDYLTGVSLDVAANHRMAVRYGVVSQPVVDPNGTLRIAQSPKGPYFLIDIDSFWQAPQDEFGEFNSDDVLAKCLQLHDPIRDIFERAITPELRERLATPLEENS